MDGSSEALKSDAVDFANRAVKCDKAGLVQTAVFYYQEAANALRLVADTASATSLPPLVEKANAYLQRAKQLADLGPNQLNADLHQPIKTQQQLDVERAKFLVEKAFEEDEQDNEEEAVELYTQAVQFCLTLRQSVSDKEVHANISRLAEQALARAEAIKHVRAPVRPVGGASGRAGIARPLGLLLQDETVARVSQPQGSGGGGGGYTKEEIQVLRTTSTINGREYVPFMSVDMRERFAYPVPFSDKHGKLALSPKQKSKMDAWARPDELGPNPQMIYAVSSFSIKQTIVSDCSFVASLAISAQYERRFRKKLITSIIYPQNRQGEPQYNPCGKYMVKLNINGVPRKVIIDDFLPVDRRKELLCSYSQNRSELWVSLLEKAYMKVMGGYDFPGSNSNIDLHALTGWIPERISLRRSDSDADSDPEREFNKIADRFHRGDCLATVATGPISDAAAERAGLVPTHAYAMLNIRNVKGQKLLQLKNPWSHLRWRGNFSELDTVHWTAEMRRELNFDPKDAATFDNGVFWIDYESLIQFFDVIYVNWNPDLFKHTTCIHHTWKCVEGPRKDNYNIGDNPQYRLQMKTNASCAIWVLLTRHITDKDDFANNREFITLLVYKGDKRVFYPSDPPPYKDGVRINSPHYLCKIVEQGGADPVNFVLVVSQYDKSNTIHYTLRVYATIDFSLLRIPHPYNSKYEKQVTCEWKGPSAGGCGNYRDTHSNNPIVQLQVANNSTDNQLLIELKGPKQYSVGMDVTTVSENVPNAVSSFKTKSTGDFRRGFCVLQLDDLPGGVYNIQPCTFYPGQEAPFFLKVNSSTPFTLTRLR